MKKLRSRARQRRYEDSINNSWNFDYLDDQPIPGPRDQALCLSWEVSGDSINQEWSPDEITAEEAFKAWLESDGVYGRDDLSISWIIPGFEEAPPFVGDDEDFLTVFTHPVHALTGEKLNWTLLPVVDKLWHPGRADDGGFIQEFTGWKPAPLQQTLHLPTLLEAIGYMR